jgi:type VI secretion system secreted protein Hcp
MAFDAYLKIDGVEGEATDEVHKGEINLLSFDFGATQPSSASIGGGSGTGKVNIQDFVVNKYTDKSSAPVFQACCSGKHFPEVTVTLCKAGGETRLDFLKYKFNDVMVTSVQWGGGAGGEEKPTETMSFAFGKVVVEYVEQTAKGSPGGTYSAGWDLIANSPVK